MKFNLSNLSSRLTCTIFFFSHSRVPSRHGASTMTYALESSEPSLFLKDMFLKLAQQLAHLLKATHANMTCCHWGFSEVLTKMFLTKRIKWSMKIMLEDWRVSWLNQKHLIRETRPERHAHIDSKHSFTYTRYAGGWKTFRVWPQWGLEKLRLAGISFHQPVTTKLYDS